MIGYLVIKDCLYVPSIRRNLISVSRLVENKYFVKFDSDLVVISKNESFICSGSLEDNLYIIYPELDDLQVHEMNNISTLPNLRKPPSKMNQTLLWHLRLGHINLNRIQ